MTVSDVTLLAFVLLNGARILAYLPQIICAFRDRNGASAVSVTTWSLFAASNLATMAYAVIFLGDWTMGCTFLLNTLSCVAIVVITLWKRANHGRVKIARPHLGMFRRRVPL